MFTFGFSYVGVIYLLLLFIPNIIWTKNQPIGYTADGESKILAMLERMGEVLCTACVLVFSDFNVRLNAWTLWLAVSFALMVLYELYWLRYFKSSKTMMDFYKPFFGFQVPGATLPVVAFFLLGIYGTNVFMILFSVILGIGHIGIHMEHYRKLNPPKPKKALRVLKGIVYTAIGLIMLLITLSIGARNINYMKHYHLIQRGVDEGIYVELGGQEQYLLVRGANQSNPVIVFLHGGPSSPESYTNYSWVDDLVENYTIVDWDQRGCGRTYIHNKNVDPHNETATFEQALTDVDELVDYARERFNQEQVILVAHSYGTILSANYLERHPEKISAYISLAQVVSMDLNNRVLTEQAVACAGEKQEDVAALEKAYDAYVMDSCVATTMQLRMEAMKHLPTPLTDYASLYAVISPYMGMDDFAWFMKQLGPMEQYVELNKQLYESLLSYDLYDVNMSHEIPITYIFGTLDYACPLPTIQEYMSVDGENSNLYIIEGSGHNVQYTKPHEVSAIIKDVLGTKMPSKK